MASRVGQMIIRIITMLMIFVMFNIPVSRATGNWGEIFDAGDNFIQQGQDEVEANAIIDGRELKTESNKIYNILLALGIVLAVIIGGILGIQMMWGSIEQQVKAKEMLMPYVMGCVVIFGAFGIWKICVTIFSQL